jgi:hypothetical protein
MKGISALGWGGKWLAICLLACFCRGNAGAQNRVHAGIGYNQSYTQLTALNNIFQAFNAENSWAADKPLHSMHLPGGLTAHIGGDFAGVLLDFQYTMRFGNNSARGPIATGSPVQQVLQVHYNASTFDLGFGIFIIRQPQFRMALGQSIDFGTLRVAGRQGVTPQVQGQIFGKYVNELNFGTSSFAHFMIAFRDGVGPGIFIRPYYQISLRQNDYAPFNRAIRPRTALSDPQFILGRQSNVGLKVGIYFGS